MFFFGSGIQCANRIGEFSPRSRRRGRISQAEQSPAVCHRNGFSAAQDIELSEKGLDVAFDGDFRDRQVSADQLVGLAGREQAQDFQFARSQFFSG